MSMTCFLLMSIKRVYNSLGVVIVFGILMGASNKAKAVDLIGNFRLYGEVNRFGLGYGDMALNFGVNIAPAQIGELGYIPGGTPFASGVLSSVSLPFGGGWSVVDTSFSLPFSLNLDEPSTLYMGIGDSGNNTIKSGSVQVIFDFSDNTTRVGSLIGFSRDQGFSLTSVTLSDGRSLEDAGYELSFFPENTVLTAAASAFDDIGAGLVVDKQTPQSNSCRRAFVSLGGGTASASSKLRGGFDFCSLGIATDSLINLDVSPEPNPFVFDVAYATVSGSNNIILARNGIRPGPSVPGPLPFLGVGAAFGYSRKLRKRIKGNKSPVVMSAID